MDADHVAAEKALLRARMRAVRGAMPAEDRSAAARAIAQRALELPELADVTATLLYGATPEEADPALLEAGLRARGVRIAYPRVAPPRALALHWVDDTSTLVPGAFGLREPAADAPPAALDDLSAIVVPAVAFDVLGYRLGFGGGYYDALLARCSTFVPTIGVAFDEQIVERLPSEGHDRPVSVVVTPTRVIRPANGDPGGAG